MKMDIPAVLALYPDEPGYAPIVLRRDDVEELLAAQEEFNRVIDFAITQGIEADAFLTAWQVGDWDACREFGFEPDPRFSYENEEVGGG